MSVQDTFGTLDGETVQAITLENANGLRARFITYGARLTELWVPDRDGQLADIVLGFETLEAYVNAGGYFGATCGRFGNRIGAGKFRLCDTDVQIDTNEGHNHLHGGEFGFDRKNWNASVTPNSVTFTAVSQDGEMGFPGRCNLAVRYELSDKNQLIVTMTADTDKTTVMNMVHHSYFNLAGQGSGDVLNQQLTLAGSFYTPVDTALIPTGEVIAVSGTPFDFRTPKAIGAEIGKLKSGNGYDHNWCLDGAGSQLRACANVFDPASGRRMTLLTSEPGVQFYAGGYLNDQMTGKQETKLCKFAGFAIETQKFPNAPNFTHFPDCTLQPGETYRHTMEFTFSTSR